MFIVRRCISTIDGLALLMDSLTLISSFTLRTLPYK
jgi:hypothetical protein